MFSLCPSFTSSLQTPEADVTTHLSQRREGGRKVQQYDPNSSHQEAVRQATAAGVAAHISVSIWRFSVATWGKTHSVLKLPEPLSVHGPESTI